MAISSDKDIRQGRYCISGTRIDVMMLRTNPRAWLLEQYEHVPVTNEMIDEALAWNFPPIQEVELDIEDWNMICVCGESYWETPELQYSSDPIVPGAYTRICQACGRKFRVTITLEPA